MLVCFRHEQVVTSQPETQAVLKTAGTAGLDVSRSMMLSSSFRFGMRQSQWPAKQFRPPPATSFSTFRNAVTIGPFIRYGEDAMPHA
jgi:hypothetical protein